MIGVLIADDHAVVRRGLREILGQTADLRVAGEAGSVPEVLEVARRVSWEVAVLDLNMPGGSGLDLVQSLKSQYPHRPILVLSMNPEDQFALRALKAGAAGYLTKESAPEALVMAIYRVIAGGHYVSAELAEQLASDLAQQRKSGHESLSHREFEVLRRIASGQGVGEIGEALSLSAKTVSTYRSRILQKLGLRHTAELVRYAILHRLV